MGSVQEVSKEAKVSMAEGGGGAIFTSAALFGRLLKAPGDEQVSRGACFSVHGHFLGHFNWTALTLCSY